MRFSQLRVPVTERKIDVKNRKILQLLGQNAREPITRIAKKTGLSKDAVKYRIVHLEKDGIIQGYLALVDLKLLGYESYHLFLRLQQVNLELKKNLIALFKSYPFCRVVIEFSGRYDFEIGIIAKSVQELDKLITRINGDISEHTQEYELLVLSKYLVAHVFPKSFLAERDEPEGSIKLKKIDIDEKDVLLLSLIAEHAIMPLYKIGQQLSMSAEAASYRMKKLRQQGLILAFRPIINLSSLGYNVYVLLMNISNLSSDREAKLRYFLQMNEHILWAVKTIGSYNLMAYICVKKPDYLHETMTALRELFSGDIKDFEALLAYEEHKYTYFPEGVRA